jgi:hypothetical protein
MLQPLLRPFACLTPDRLLLTLVCPSLHKACPLLRILNATETNSTREIPAQMDPLRMSMIAEIAAREWISCGQGVHAVAERVSEPVPFSAGNPRDVNPEWL